MKSKKVVTRKIVSPDGRIVAEAQSTIFSNDDDNLLNSQWVHVEYDSSGTQTYSASASVSQYSSE